MQVWLESGWVIFGVMLAGMFDRFLSRLPSSLGGKW